MICQGTKPVSFVSSKTIGCKKKTLGRNVVKKVERSASLSERKMYRASIKILKGKERRRKKENRFVAVITVPVTKERRATKKGTRGGPANRMGKPRYQVGFQKENGCSLRNDTKDTNDGSID